MFSPEVHPSVNVFLFFFTGLPPALHRAAFQIHTYRPHSGFLKGDRQVLHRCKRLHVENAYVRISAQDKVSAA